MKAFKDQSVKQVFDSYPTPFKSKLLYLRELIYETAEQNSAVGELEETLKWAEPSYLTTQTKSGSTIRMDWKQKTPEQYALYFNCKTTLIDSFKAKYGDLFRYDGNRTILFHKDDIVPEDELCDCILMALTYHIR
jgi:hypothetical protein